MKVLLFFFIAVLLLVVAMRIRVRFRSSKFLIVDNNEYLGEPRLLVISLGMISALAVVCLSIWIGMQAKFPDLIEVLFFVLLPVLGCYLAYRRLL
ncbi:MAG: hypothetical protein RMM17_03390 [Acidobacteriota bacterium]|nr:hypothetical protein [Blastocatellia bacterium]MDW8411712.1 hypothetical protein [Acidobacteriota bacterium]